ncbi:hypothetical protein K2F45_19900 [Sphingobacterium siyangense]|uniref:hypothetical protein n=1 Tax=Sphingobacterium TaxID=28453 RepID=UPI00200E1C7F|nr:MULTISPECIES: hypothetical protein [Sphingobacterium]UQA74058.1 hypothetical protein K2F45_19900 [Sphingobacterium siyangense]
MKALKEMTFVDKGHVLAGLFPELLKEWVDFIKNETEYFRSEEEYYRNNWQSKTFIAVGFWYNLVTDIEHLLRKFNVALYRNPKVFADQLFYGFFAVFTSNCLIQYAESEHCSLEARLAIHLLFGQGKNVEHKIFKL